jgi:hypothetical protein
MTTAHLLIIVLPSLAAGLLLGPSLLTAVIWGIVAEVMGLILVILPIAGGPRISLSLRMAALSIVLGAIAGGLGFGLRRLRRAK